MAIKIDGEAGLEMFFNQLFGQAVTANASDIHIEPLSDKVRIRFRVDGKLQEKESRPIEELEHLVNRIKVLSDLEISGKPIPQDGHFELYESGAQMSDSKVEMRPFDPQSNARIVNIRVSIFPTIFGEAVVMRLLNRAEMLISLKNFEMDETMRALVKKLISKNQGMLLVTGPAGSGKTSMLYSIIEELKTKEKNIITLEDPVEYQLPEIRQCQVKPDQGLTFAVGMKSILRQDPDVIMIGEIRDPETAEYAMRASLMGRSVFSTVHSNSTVGIIARLIDMNVEHGLIAYALNGSISKRLVRRVCPRCRTPYVPTQNYLDYFNVPKDHKYQFVKGAGCFECNNTGYKGRVGLFEIMEIDDNMRSLIVEKAPMAKLQEYVEKHMKTLKQDALDKIIAGDTTFEEAMSVV